MKIKVPGYLTDKFVPDLNAVNLLEYFLISAISAFLVIRLFLGLTGFPIIGGDELHFAHMLWGGIFMLLAIIVYSTFINTHSKTVGAILGGIGFGTFIDELGKFITADNDYFYKPTIALIYIIFIFIFLFIRWISSISEYSSKTYLANSIEVLRELVILDLDISERKRALKYLKKCDSGNYIVNMLKDIIEKTTAAPPSKSFYITITLLLFGWYKNTLHAKFISQSLILFFIITTLSNSFLAIYRLYYWSDHSFSDLGTFFSSIIVGVFVVLAIRFYLKGKRLHMYYYLQHASLVAILFLQFFLFLQNEMTAFFSFVMFLSIYLVIKYAIEAERRYKI
ncbi:hypothetical protein IPM62_05660 [Candidatus Woesebacteria bacterium]|nr:MAG: hypothetical protein IPM62_05660 [Candidatus Woesebacteria bacterium]